MNKEQLLRSFDTLIGMVVAYDNQNQRSCFIGDTLESIEQIRELIKDMKNED